MKPLKVLPVLSLCLLAAEPAFAQWSMSATAGAQQTELKEYDPRGRELVREQGWMPGAGLRAEYARNAWRFGVGGSTYGGSIAYDGHLQNGAQFSTYTDATQDRLGTDANYRLSEAASLIGGIEWEHRKRRINGQASAGGLDERTTSWRVLAGANMRLVQFAAATIDAKGLIVFAQAERLDVRFDRHAFDDASFSTKPAVGLRAAFTAIPAGAPRLSAVFEFEWMRIGRSEDAVLRRDGAAEGTVTQPEHRRRTFGAGIAYRFD